VTTNIRMVRCEPEPAEGEPRHFNTRFSERYPIRSFPTGGYQGHRRLLHRITVSERTSN